MTIDQEILKLLISKILTEEKKFLNEKNMTETKKVREIKRIIEKEVNINDN